MNSCISVSKLSKWGFLNWIAVRSKNLLYLSRLNILNYEDLKTIQSLNCKTNFKLCELFGMKQAELIHPTHLKFLMLLMLANFDLKPTKNGLTGFKNDWTNLKISDVDPSGAPLDGVVGSEDLGLEPGQVVDANAVFLAGYCDQNVLTLQNFHLLEAASWNQLVDFTLKHDILNWIKLNIFSDWKLKHH